MVRNHVSFRAPHLTGPAEDQEAGRALAEFVAGALAERGYSIGALEPLGYAASFDCARAGERFLVVAGPANDGVRSGWPSWSRSAASSRASHDGTMKPRSLLSARPWTRR